jgi:DNA polymerase-3 subunit gamma/tau
MKFEDVIGQAHVTTTLRNALAAGRLAHAYLFSGPRGVGKTTTARILAKTVNCLHLDGSNPDNKCENCLEITEGRSFDVLEIDGASNRGVDEIRNLRESARYAPAKGKYKVYIIDEVHMLTKEAFNALLKTLEEPPGHVLFIFATTEIHKVPATILSRCQRFDFRRIAVNEIVANLKEIAASEGLHLDDEAFLLVARKGDGSLRDAQSIFDQVVSLCGKDITHTQIVVALHIVDQEVYFRVTDLIKARDAHAGLELVDEIMRNGHDIKEFLSGLTEHLRNILVAKVTGATTLIEASDLYRTRYAAEAKAFTVADLLRYQRLVASTESAIRWSSIPRFRFEADMVQLLTMQQAPDVAEVLARLDELKKKTGEEASHTSALRTPASPVPPHSPAPKPPIHQTFVSPTPHETAMPIGDADVASRWAAFIGEVRRQRISLGSVLDSTRFLGVRGGAIHIGCGNDFQVSSVMRNREFLAEIVNTVFHTRVRIEAEISEAFEQSQPAAENGEHNGQQMSDDDHPVIAAMKRELGAEPIE